MTTNQSTAFGYHRLGVISSSKHNLFSRRLAETKKQTVKKLKKKRKYFLLQSPHWNFPSVTRLKLLHCGKEQLNSTRFQSCPYILISLKRSELEDNSQANVDLKEDLCVCVKSAGCFFPPHDFLPMDSLIINGIVNKEDQRVKLFWLLWNGWRSTPLYRNKHKWSQTSWMSMMLFSGFAKLVAVRQRVINWTEIYAAPLHLWSRWK